MNSCIINIYKQSIIFNNTISLFLIRTFKSALLFYSNPVFNRRKTIDPHIYEQNPFILHENIGKYPQILVIPQLLPTNSSFNFTSSLRFIFTIFSTVFLFLHKKANCMFILLIYSIKTHFSRSFSSVGQSAVLITRMSWVRSPQWPFFTIIEKIQCCLIWIF